VLVVETRVFTASIDALLSDDEYREMQLYLVAYPEAGNVIPGTGGLRKFRWAARGRGKRGGARIVYFWHRASETVLLLFAYPKNERADLSTAQKRALRALVESEYP
jgi:mRNA-degrading endonuclease RelE of RelBE toxin-antitoxin system